MTTRRQLAQGILGAAMFHPLAGPARAASYPDRPIRFVVPYAAGGNGDVSVRALTPRMSEVLGQAIVVENRAGAGGSVGALQVARLRPDGYTLMLGSNGPLTVNPSLRSDLGYDPLADFSPIGLACRTPVTVAVGASVPVRTLGEFVAYARAHPERASMGSPGAGSNAHLALAMFNAATGLALQHVPYGSGGALLPDLLSGTLPGAFVEVSTVLPLHRQGTARILGVAAGHRIAAAADVPTFEEGGIADYRAAAFIGVVGPAGLPADVVAALQAALAAAVSDPAVRERLQAMGSDMASPDEATAEGFAAFLRRELAWSRAAAARAGLRG